MQINLQKNLEKKVTKNLIQDYSNLLKGNSFNDFSIFVENEPNPFEIKVHKSILSSRSPFFNEFLREENDIDKISLNQFNKKEMESILSYIYHGNISFENQENLFELLEISIYFKLGLLEKIIQKKISDSVNNSNFFQFFFQNRSINSNEMEMKCFELINQNFSQIKNNGNLFNLTQDEIIKFIRFKQEKKEIFHFDFFQFLNQWIKKRNKSLKGKKENEKKFEKKRLFHSFFSLFEKDSISKQDFDKLKQFEIFLPNSFLVNLEKPLLEIKKKQVVVLNNQIIVKQKENRQMKKENENLKTEIEDKWKKELDKKDKENEQMKKEIKEKETKIGMTEKENENLKSEIEKRDQEIIEKTNENMKLKLENKQSAIQINLQKKEEIENKHENDLINSLKDSEIIKDIEHAKKLQEWINDNDFFSKMKKGFSAKRDGFSCQKWHDKCDNQGKTLVIIKTKQNFIFGGFTQVGFTNDKSKWKKEDRNFANGYIIDPNSFIFSLRNDKNNRKPEKFSIRQDQQQNAIGYDETEGPSFGEGGFGNWPDFHLNINLNSGHSNFGSSYNLPNGIKEETNEAYTYLAGSPKSWVVDELETYFI
ncbi:pep-cterm sorting domain-containing protein [Anaeramoeba ignava]|uniref:Pep-cterm sorting domain-containing protein n=1 Tax=Anaeramoeba ignava TaxID=1746090 RepID=A0A9Q0R4H0_ANAIG|nr:pep-cterm sorting domain-containing protein [Anaeramoeba ignava]